MENPHINLWSLLVQQETQGPTACHEDLLYTLTASTRYHWQEMSIEAIPVSGTARGASFGATERAPCGWRIRVFRCDHEFDSGIVIDIPADASVPPTVREIPTEAYRGDLDDWNDE